MTDVTIDPQAGLITIFLAQLPHGGAWRQKEGYRILPIFQSIAYRMQLVSILSSLPTSAALGHPKTGHSK